MGGLKSLTAQKEEGQDTVRFNSISEFATADLEPPFREGMLEQFLPAKPFAPGFCFCSKRSGRAPV